MQQLLLWKIKWSSLKIIKILLLTADFIFDDLIFSKLRTIFYVYVQLIFLSEILHKYFLNIFLLPRKILKIKIVKINVIIVKINSFLIVRPVQTLKQLLCQKSIKNYNVNYKKFSLDFQKCNDSCTSLYLKFNVLINKTLNALNTLAN